MNKRSRLRRVSARYLLHRHCLLGGEPGTGKTAELDKFEKRASWHGTHCCVIDTCTETK